MGPQSSLQPSEGLVTNCNIWHMELMPAASLQASGTGARIFQLQQQQMPQLATSQAATLSGQVPLAGDLIP